jgi:hypothetical protein
MEDVYGMKYEDHLEWVNENRAKGIEIVTELCTQEVCNRALQHASQLPDEIKTPFCFHLYERWSKINDNPELDAKKKRYDIVYFDADGTPCTKSQYESGIHAHLDKNKERTSITCEAFKLYTRQVRGDDVSANELEDLGQRLLKLLRNKKLSTFALLFACRIIV